ncbi:MAG: DUF445 family protein [Campylobacterales bacterium]|nr:DUF445 family protein [Campylobacterales bacterium]
MKTLIINLTTVFIIILSFFLPHPIDKHTLNVGLYALSGAITNSLAIYMIFHKVPLLYGSGVIEKNFEAFKNSIKSMIMEQFFSKENISRFLQKENQDIDFASIIAKVDLGIAFESLKTTIMESKFGSLLGMFGGEGTLDTFQKPFEEKLRGSLIKITSSESFKKMIESELNSNLIQEDILSSIEKIVTERLEELTPQMVKEIVESIIKEHLGWLVIWGGVFGGILGLGVSVFIS